MKLAQVAAFAESLPNVTVGARWNNKTWLVNDRGFLWQRPLSKADIERYGEATPPRGEIIAFVTADLDAKDALLAMELPGFFTIQHFNNYPGVLVELRLAGVRDVKAAIRSAYEAAVAKGPPKKRRAKKPKAR
ncbi:MAG TPA: hypothetical protein VIV58_13405 [Kofleriaceae bacterium]